MSYIMQLVGVMEEIKSTTHSDEGSGNGHSDEHGKDGGETHFYLKCCFVGIFEETSLVILKLLSIIQMLREERALLYFSAQHRRYQIDV